MPAAFVSDQERGFFPPVPRRPQVLVVEDNAALARTMRWAVLAKCEVTAVGTVQDAVQCLVRPWDAFIFDVALPDGSGLALMRKARKARPGAGALVISGEDRYEDADAAVAMGACFLAKPFAPSDVLQFLDTCLPTRLSENRSGGSGPSLPDFSQPDEEQEPSGLVPTPLPPHVAKLVEAARGSGRNAATAESEHAYQLAVLARTVRTGRLSAASVDLCARAAGVSRQMLQNFVTLTARWDPERIAEMLTMTDRSARTISRVALLKVARGPSSLRRRFEEQLANGELDLGALLREPGESGPEGKSQ